MPSKLKRHLHASRRRPHAARPDVAQLPPALDLGLEARGPVQTLRLRCNLDFMEGDADITDLASKGVADMSNLRLFLTLWQGGPERASVEIKSNPFYVDLPLVDNDIRTTQAELGAYFEDEETELAKVHTIDASSVVISPLLAGVAGKVTVDLRDPFSSNHAKLTMEAVNRVHVTLRESPLERLAEFNAALAAVSDDTVDQVKLHSCRVPEEAQAFVAGMTSLSSGGVPELNTGNVSMHYGLLGHFYSALKRVTSLPIMAHHLYASLWESGLAMPLANRLPPKPFARLFCDVLYAITRDPSMFAYQGDQTVDLSMNLSAKSGALFGLRPVTTENIGLPMSATSYLGRQRPGVIVQCPEAAQARSVPDLFEVARRRLAAAGTGRIKVPGLRMLSDQHVQPYTTERSPFEQVRPPRARRCRHLF